MGDLRIFCDARLSEDAMNLLQEKTAPHRVIFPEQVAESVLGAASIDPALAQADIALGQPGAEGVLQSERLRWLQVTSAGFTRYDTPEFRAGAKARQLIVTNSSAVYAEACAEHAFTFMLAQSRQLPVALQTRCASGSAEWNRLRNTCVTLRNQQVVILGFGTIAARLVELLAPFQAKITAMRRHPRGDEKVAVVTPENLAPVLATADHVVSILPENDDSFHFVAAERLKQMKRGAIFYNIGRGRTVDQDALDASLRSGHLGAAWLDVTEPEPLPDDHPLGSTPNCFITPHTAGGHAHESETLVRHFLDNFQLFLQGAPLRDRIM